MWHYLFQVSDLGANLSGVLVSASNSPPRRENALNGASMVIGGTLWLLLCVNEVIPMCHSCNPRNNSRPRFHI